MENAIFQMKKLISFFTALAIIFFVMIVDTITDDKKSQNKNEHKGESDNEKI